MYCMIVRQSLNQKNKEIKDAEEDLYFTELDSGIKLASSERGKRQG